MTVAGIGTLSKSRVRPSLVHRQVRVDIYCGILWGGAFVRLLKPLEIDPWARYFLRPYGCPYGVSGTLLLVELAYKRCWTGGMQCDASVGADLGPKVPNQVKERVKQNGRLEIFW